MLEAKDRVGGVIWTERTDGFTLEGGPDSFITNKPWGIDLCHRLGLADQLIETDPSHRRSFVVRNGRLAPVPEGFVLMAPHRILPDPDHADPLVAGQAPDADGPGDPAPGRRPEESLASFVRRRLGREALDRLVQPLVGGIYTADPNDLSLKATLPQFLAMEREHGSLIRAAWHQHGLQRKSRRKTGRPRVPATGCSSPWPTAWTPCPHAGRRAAAGHGPHRARRSAGSAATGRLLPGWSSCSTARRSRPTR